MVYSNTLRKWRDVADRNPRGFVTERLKIADPMGREVPFQYRHGQLEYSKRKQYILKRGIPLRLADIKYRRAGFSAVETAEAFAACWGRDNARFGVISHLESRSSELLSNFKNYNESLNRHYPHLKQELSRDNFFGIKFEESRSQVLIASAQNPIKVRGDGLHGVHGSEFAHWYQYFNNVMKELSPVVPPVAGSQICLESTGTVLGSQPWEFWMECTPWDEFIRNDFKRTRGKNVFVSHFTSWLRDPECVVGLDDPEWFTPGQEEKQYLEYLDEMRYKEPRLVTRNHYFGLTPGQILWSWRAYQQQAKSDYTYFCREFPYEENDAWLSGGDSFFDNDALSKARAQHPRWVFAVDPVERCKIFDGFEDLKMLDQEQANNLEDDSPFPVIKVWVPPIPGEQYVLGSDSSLGHENSDYSAGYMINMKTREMVACYHGHIRPDEAAHLNVSLCRMYNRAMSAPEINAAGGGLEILNIMERLQYHNFYNFKRYDHQDGIMNTKYLGWMSTSRTRPMMLGEMRKLFLDCVEERINLTGVFRDKALLNEMRKFIVNKNGKAEAAEGCYDDRVIAFAIAHQAACDTVAGTRHDILRMYNKIIAPPRPIIDPSKPLSAAQMSRVMSPERTMEKMFGKNSAFMKNRFEL